MVEIEKRKVRTNGFACPLHPTQVFSYVLYGSNFISYFMINMASLGHNQPLAISLSTVYLILSMGTFYYGLLATKIDPTDPTINLERDCKK